MSGTPFPHDGSFRGPWARTRMVVLGLFRNDGFQRAASLAFDTILAVVPMLAIVVSVLKMTGAYASIDQPTLRFWLQHTVGLEQDDHLVTLEDAINQILDVVEKTNLASVGVIGVLALLYAVMSLFHSVESSLDAVFGTEHTRPLRRRLLNYAAFLFILPLLVIAASVPLAALLSRATEQGLALVIVHLGSALAATVGLTVVFRLTPNVLVRWRAALIGGLVGGVTGYAALQAQVLAQIGVARYNLLYSSLAALPLLLLWLYVSWAAVMLGAETAAFLNDSRDYRWRAEGRRASHIDRERLALHIATLLATAHRKHEPPKTAEELAQSAGDVPVALMNRVLEALEIALIVRNTGGRPPRYEFLGDDNRTTAADVLRAVQREGSVHPPPPDGAPGVDDLLIEIESAVVSAAGRLTLADLAGEPKSDREGDSS